MIETDRLIAAAPESPQEEALERALRPKLLTEYVGQEKIRNQLGIFIDAELFSPQRYIDHRCNFVYLLFK